jgi:hypothetical protein
LIVTDGEMSLDFVANPTNFINLVKFVGIPASRVAAPVVDRKKLTSEQENP